MTIPEEAEGRVGRGWKASKEGRGGGGERYREEQPQTWEHNEQSWEGGGRRRESMTLS